MQYLPLVLSAVLVSMILSPAGSFPLMKALDSWTAAHVLGHSKLGTCALTCHSCSVLECRCMYQPQDCGLLAKSSAVGVPSLPMKPRLTLWLAHSPVPDSQMLCRK